jgi:penicillin amidase
VAAGGVFDHQPLGTPERLCGGFHEALQEEPVGELSVVGGIAGHIEPQEVQELVQRGADFLHLPARQQVPQRGIGLLSIGGQLLEFRVAQPLLAGPLVAVQGAVPPALADRRNQGVVDDRGRLRGFFRYSASEGFEFLIQLGRLLSDPTAGLPAVLGPQGNLDLGLAVMALEIHGDLAPEIEVTCAGVQVGSRQAVSSPKLGARTKPRVRPMPVPRLLLWFSASLLLIGLAAAVAVYVLASRAEPAYDGKLVLPGLKAPVTVDYGPRAVASLRAENPDDLLFAQGFVTASERMWQMDLLRRAACGRLAEVFGEQALPMDRLMRTLGLAWAAERNLAALGPQARALLRAYAAGVNAYRAAASKRPPLEYVLTHLEPMPWTPLDSVAIIEYMSYLLSFNAREELAFLRVARRIGPERARELFPADEGMPAEALPAGLEEIRAGIANPFAAADNASAALGLPRPGPASNAWALANDPHLLASVPNTWFEQELYAPGLHVSGATIPGLPLVLIGHNMDLAWGLTTTMADTQDLVIERLADDGQSVQRPDGSEPIRERWEDIPVRGGKAHPLRIRETDNGVILNDVLAEERGLPQDFVVYKSDDLLALRSTIALPDTAFEGLHRLNTARSIDAARTAVRLIVHGSQNVLIAHRDGSIAWQVSGRLPIREHGTGSLPVPGWIAGYGWNGYLPSEANPYWINPPEGQLVSANNRSVAPDHPVQVGHSWMAPYRAQRITELLGQRSDLTLDDMAAIQTDQLSIEARHYQAALARVAPELQALDGPERGRCPAAAGLGRSLHARQP